MAINRKNRVIFELDADARTSAHNEGKCMRGGHLFVGTSYGFASRGCCVRSPLHFLNIHEKGGSETPRVPLIELSHQLS